ncbi:MAG: TRAP transporter large permease [Desulfohalobiaceae bacterium]|nr:TRAP transporter large permease [Desulfohalobiaceae bacterium]
MSSLTGLLILVALLFFFLATGLEIAFSLGLAGMIGLFCWQNGFHALSAVGEIAWDVCTSFTLMAIPLFIFMGAILIESGMSNGLYTSISKWLRWLPGGLAVASQIACAIFAAVSGSSLATAGAIGRVAIPEMEARGYQRKLSAGCIAAGGTMGLLIPPSTAFIIYGTIMETSIGQLFIAGVVPGILLAALFSGFIIIYSILDPSIAPRDTQRVGFGEKIASLKQTFPIICLIILVLGGIYSGFATPTEAAGIGAFGSLVITALYRKLDYTALKNSLLLAVRTSAMIFMILIGALILSRIVTFLHIPQAFISFLDGMDISPWVVFTLVCLLYYVLGSMLDAISIMTITLPIIGPMVITLGFDPIWFGVVMVLLIEVGLITPPIGLNLFVIHGITYERGGSFQDIVFGSLPFVVLLTIFIVIVCYFPGIALWLPNLMIS